MGHRIEPLDRHPTYKKIRDLDKGAFGWVQLAQNIHTGEYVAIKFIPLGPRFFPRYVEREIINHRRLVHPHIVQFREVILMPRHLGIVMEYVGGGNLQSLVESKGRLPEALARCLFQQLVVALRHCHARRGIAHRDIKLGNLLLDARFAVPILKVCDFGYSKALAPDSAPKTRVGTAAYCAPEVAASLNETPYDTEKADVWSAGVTLFCMLAGRYPFTDADSGPARLKSIANLTDDDVARVVAQIEAPGPDPVGGPSTPSAVDGPGATTPPASPAHLASPGAAELLRRMLRIDPGARYGFADVYADPWFQTYLPDTSRMEADAEAEIVRRESSGTGPQAEAEVRRALRLADAASRRLNIAEEEDVDDIMDELEGGSIMDGSGF